MEIANTQAEELAEKNSLLVLNDDCIYEILKWVQIDDLPGISRTCTRLQMLCYNKFAKTFRKRVFKINVIDFEGRIRVSNGKLITCFNNFIEKLLIIAVPKLASGGFNVSSLVRFIKRKCHPKLHLIVISANFNLVPFCYQIQEFLQSLDVVVLGGQMRKGEVEFLKCCPNMTKLILQRRLLSTDQILLEKYNKLRYFYCQYGPEFEGGTQLQMFSQMNDSIERLAIKDFGYGEILSFPISKSIWAIDHFLHLTHFYFNLESRETFVMIFEYLKRLCERPNFKCLEIAFLFEQGRMLLREHAFRLYALQKLTKIYMRYFFIEDVIVSLQPMVQLRTVVLQYPTPPDWSIFFELQRIKPCHSLPQVEEVQIEYPTTYGFNDKIDGMLVYFVRYWKNLKRILLPDYGHQTKIDVDKLNRERALLPGACTVTVYTNDESNKTNLKPKLVKLRMVEFDSECFEHPFHIYLLKTKLEQ